MTTTTEQLRNAVTEMDGLAQGAFSEIAIIAKLALASLETPESYSYPDGIAKVLSVIWSKAMDAENCINSTAEGVGCNYKDEAKRRRWDAKRKAGETTTSGRA